MPKFFIDKNNVLSTNIIISGADIKHITKVLRKQLGDVLEVSDGQGNDYIVKITEINKENIITEILSQEKDDLDKINVTLFQALPKSTKMDVIIQKCTELGVSQIIPFTSRRTVVEIKDRKSEQKKSERWQKIASEACKQCQRSKIPHVGSIHTWNELLDEVKKYELCIVAYENEKNKCLKDVLKSNSAKNICVIVGPEGGFEESEISEIVNAGGRSVSLGKRILRTETAGMVILSIIMYEFDEI